MREDICKLYAHQLEVSKIDKKKFKDSIANVKDLIKIFYLQRQFSKESMQTIYMIKCSFGHQGNTVFN